MSPLENAVKELRKKNSNWESYYKALMNYFTKNINQDEFFYKFNELLNELQKKTNKKIFDIDYIYKNIFGYGNNFNNLILTKKSTLDKNKTVMDMKNIIYYLDNIEEYHVFWDKDYSKRLDYESIAIMSQYILQAKNIKNRDKIILNEFYSASKISDFFMSLEYCVKKNLITIAEQKRTEKLIKKVVKENINKIQEYTINCIKRTYIDNKYKYFNFIFDFKNNKMEKTLFLMIMKSEQNKYKKYKLIKNILNEGYIINSYDIKYLIENNINLLSKIYMKKAQYINVSEYIKDENMMNFLNSDNKNNIKYKNVEEFKIEMEKIYLQQKICKNNKNNNEIVKTRRKL